MEGLQQYILTVVITAMICGILSGLTENTASKAFIRLLCGLLLAVSVLRPVADISFQKLDSMDISFMRTAEEAAADGEKMMRDAITDIIKNETEAYILDKAASLNVSLDVDVEVNDENLPERAVMTGAVSPYAKLRLETYLESDLGISKENQKWTG